MISPSRNVRRSFHHFGPVFTWYTNMQPRNLRRPARLSYVDIRLKLSCVAYWFESLSTILPVGVDMTHHKSSRWQA
jgi:hypothetical protein